MSTVAKRLYATDETFREVADLLFGSGGDDLVTRTISKMNPDGADLASKKDRRVRGLTAGLSAVGAGAGAYGLGVGAHEIGRNAKKAGSLKAGLKATPKSIKGLIPLEVAGLTGEVMATHILHGDTKKKRGAASTKVKKSHEDSPPVTKGRLTLMTLNTSMDTGKAIAESKTGKKAIKGAKRLPEKVVSKSRANPGFFRSIRHTAQNVRQASSNADRASEHMANSAEHMENIAARADKYTSRAGIATMGGVAVGSGGIGYGLGSRRQKQPKIKTLKPSKKKVIGKADTFDITWHGEISKVNEDKRQVFGWASVVEMNGEPIVDRQGDYISIDEIEKSAYTYVQKSRKGGDMHKRDASGPRHVSDMIESFVVTPEKVEKMGLPEDTPIGWWVGYQIHDEDTWNIVKSGGRTGFSIHGSGQRKAI